MQTRIQALILALALLGAGAPVQAQDDAATPVAAAPEAPAAEAPAAEAPDTEAAAAAAPAEDADKGKVSVDIDIDTDEDDGGDVVGRALGTGLAAILEEHVLTHDELSEEDREEVREAIAELRGEVQTETRKAAKEITKGLGNEIGKEIKDAVKEKRRVVVHSSDDDGFGFLQAIVAIVAIVFTLGMPIIIVSLIMYSSYRRRRLAHETITQYVSSGKEIPPEIMQNLFKDAGATQTPRTNLHKGSVNTGIGLGMVVGFSLIDVEFLAAIGFIFLLVGLAQLLIWKLEQGKKSGGDVTQG